MALTVTTNLASINAQRSLGKSQNAINKSFAQLSSGTRITKAADDAAGLSISEGLKSDIRAFNQANRNANDGISMIQVAEGSLSEVGNILTRFKELGVQAASDTISDSERSFINQEVQQLKSEIQRIAESTRFGDLKLLDGTGTDYSIQVGINNDDFTDRIEIKTSELVATTDALGVDGFDFSTKDGARSALDTVKEAQTRVNGYRAELGAMQNRMVSTSQNIGTAVENFSAAKSRISDTDIAESTADLTRNNILLNASQTVLAQANQIPSNALRLLG